MSTQPDIPEAYRPLIACLRGAVSGLPPDPSLTSPAFDWQALLLLARQHGVDTFLYPWLATRLPEAFSAKAARPPDCAQAAWRACFLEALRLSAQRRRQLAELLTAFAHAELQVLPLKGAWLCETVYDDPAQRSMADLDLLVHADDRDASHALFRSLGYAAATDTLHNPFANDQSYRHPAHPLSVELHWHFGTEQFSDLPLPDISSIWDRSQLADCCGHTVRALSPADQVAHLVQHVLHHLFAMHLRGYLDLALYLQKRGSLLDAEALSAASTRWKTGRAIPFMLTLVAGLFDLPLPSPLAGYAADAPAEMCATAFRLLFSLPQPRERDGETTLLRFRNSSQFGRLLLVASRIFMPREILAFHYPSARHPWGLPWAWLCRARDLHAQNRARIKGMLTEGTHDAHLLANAEARLALVNDLLKDVRHEARCSVNKVVGVTSSPDVR